MSIALAGACELAFLTCLRETYKVTLLRRRAARLRKETGNPLIKTPFDLADDEDGKKKLWESIMRPTVVFADSGVLQAISLSGSVAFAYFYIMSTTLPDILERSYNLPPALIGASFIAFSKWPLFQG